MSDEPGFLQSLLDAPKDAVTAAVYADWLEEQGDDVSARKAEFLRLTLRNAANETSERSARLRQLAAALDTGWLAVVSRLAIELCPNGRQDKRPRRVRLNMFQFVCDRRWEDLKTTGEVAVRYCDECRKDVYYCDTITEARERAERDECIAVDLGVIRREGDLQPQRLWLGMPSIETLREEEERTKPDAVSAARDAARRAKGEGSTG